MQIDLKMLSAFNKQGSPIGVTSVCSAHPIVLRAALRFGRQHESTILIEATCNQVNHLGGYTGMRLGDFAALVRSIAAEEGSAFFLF
jgi:tagatose-1,6-bisphosphate aldolase non-catalytic subunit AgaZ/GatZ